MKFAIFLPLSLMFFLSSCGSTQDLEERLERRNDSYQNYQEQKEAEYAYNETRKALSLLAANLERGTEKVAYLNQFEEAKDKIYNND